MISTTASLDIDNDHIINFKIVYSSDHIGWIQFIEKKIQVQPKLVHISDDRVFFFVDSDEFTEASRNWHRYLKKTQIKIFFISE